MAIAFDAVAHGIANGNTVNNFTHVCGSGNTILIVEVCMAGTGDSVSGVTYNSVSMTRSSFASGTDVNDGAWSRYIYFLYSPSSGSNTVSVSYSGTQSGSANSASYTGVKQSGFPDVSTSGTQSTNTVTLTATTVLDNCWTVMFAHTSLSIMAAGTGSTSRQLNLSSSVWFKESTFDSNAALTPAGSKSMVFTQTSSTSMEYMCAIAPSVAATGNSNFLAFM